jgi:tRNA threonylcarbamoyl adenosine modification protein (Sua5/YciO/YrdC/YwlC family)
MDEAVAAAARSLDRGGIIVLPTDTVYGLAARAEDARAVERIYELKGRAEDKPLQVLVSRSEWPAELAESSPAAERLARAFWPGPLTIVVAAAASAPGHLVRDGAIGLRAPDHPVVLALARASGPLAATSANRSGEPTPSTIDAIRDLFGSAVDVYVDGGTIAAAASTVVDLTGAEPVIVRDGAITAEALKGAIGGR